MILCNRCKGTGSIPAVTPFAVPTECGRCGGSGRLSLRDLRHGDHACLLFKDPIAQLSDALDFLIEGLHRGERLFYAWDHHDPQDIRVKLIEKGVDVTREIERGALEIVRATDIYVSGGEFDPQRALNFFIGYIEATLRAGFTGLRATAESTWALKRRDWIDRIAEYEALADEYVRLHKPAVIGLCQYDRTRFNPEHIHAALETHDAAVLS